LLLFQFEKQQGISKHTHLHDFQIFKERKAALETCWKFVLVKDFPKVKKIETDCLEGNDLMILINKKIGFRRKRSQLEKEIILEKLFLHDK
jgi:hypothetical protein